MQPSNAIKGKSTRGASTNDRIIGITVCDNTEIILKAMNWIAYCDHQVHYQKISPGSCC